LDIFDKLDKLDNFDSSEGFFVKYDTKFVESQYWKYYKRYHRAKKRAEALEKELKEKDELRKAYRALFRMLVRFLANISVTPEMITAYRKALKILAEKDRETYDFAKQICMQVINALEKRIQTEAKGASINVQRMK